MSEQPLLPSDLREPPGPPSFKDQLKRGLRRCCLVIGGLLLVAVAVAWAIQGLIYWWVTSASGCSPGRLANYSYPGGDSSRAGPASYNMLPEISLLAERPPMWYGTAFDVIPSNEASTVADAPSGTWWRTWGPWFPTYTYEDVENSRTTVVMRRNLMRLGMSHRILRCDGKGPRVTITEGANWLVNRVRAFFKMNQGSTFKIYLDDELVAVAEETGNGFQSVTFRDAKTGDKISSSILQDRHFHGKYDEWLVRNTQETPLPYYVTSASTLLFAVHTLNTAPKGEAPPRKSTGPTKFMTLLNGTGLSALPHTALHANHADVDRAVEEVATVLEVPAGVSTPAHLAQLAPRPAQTAQSAPAQEGSRPQAAQQKQQREPKLGGAAPRGQGSQSQAPAVLPQELI